MDRQEAALIVMGVPFRHFLMAVHNVERVVDVQNHRDGRLLVTPAPDIDQCVGEADDLPQRRRILPARDGGLRAQIRARVRQPSAGQLEGGIGAQPVEIVTVGIAAGNRQHAGPQHILHGVRDVRRIARIGDQSGEGLGNAAAPFGQGKQHDAAIGGKPPAIERSCDFLARNGWIGER